jgi:NAD(P)H dehydrogenase (quinone)
MRIAITGASGQLGMATLRELAARVSALDIVAITRRPDKLEQFSARGITVRAGDFNDPAGLEKAFEGIERLLIIPGSDLQPDVRPRQHRAAIDAAVAAGVRHIIYVSTVGARPGKSDGIFETHFATEQALIGSGAEWTLLRMSVYADMLIDSAKRAIDSGTYAALAGAPAAYIVRDDLAAAAAGLLATNGHEGITYHATGPAPLTAAQFAEIVSAISGKRVTFVPITIEQLEAGLTAAGLPSAVVKVISRFQAALRDGAFDLLTGDVERLAGRRPEPVESFLGRRLQSGTQQVHA